MGTLAPSLFHKRVFKMKDLSLFYDRPSVKLKCSTHLRLTLLLALPRWGELNMD